MDRCVDQLMSDNDDLEEDDAIDALPDGLDDRGDASAARRAATSGTTFKTHAAEVHGMEFILSNESIESLRRVISASGWDLDNFSKNPIALFGHRSDFPIGKWSNLRVDGVALKGHLTMAT